MRAIHLNNDNVERVANTLKAIAHPLRIKVVRYLELKKEAVVNEIVQSLQAEQSLVSHHLSKMYDSGLLSTRKEGKNVFYSLSNSSILEALDCINNCKKV